jgi:VWFA-related protein
LVSGLKAEDFVVKEDGSERRIVSFAAFAKGESTEAGPSSVVVEPSPKAAPEAAKVGPVTTVLFVDDGQLAGPDAVRLKPALKKLIDIISERNGVLALVAPWSGVQMADEVEGNRALFGAAVDKIVGHLVDDRSPFPITDAEAITIERGDTAVLERVANRFVYFNRGLTLVLATVQARGRATEVTGAARARRGDAYAVLLKCLDFLARKPGRHNVVMVSGGYASDSDDAMQREVVTRSLQANAPIHFFDARGLQGMSRFLGVEYRQALEEDAFDLPFTFSDAAAGASGLAEDTGGLYIRNTNDITKGLTRLLDMSATYYVLGYEPPEHKKPGFRKIKVEVLTKGLHVTARRGYYGEVSTPR